MDSTLNCEPLKHLIRTVPDFPKPGILFYDITTLLKDKNGFAQLIDALRRLLHRQGDRPRPRHRGPRLHLRPGARLPPERRLRPRAQAQEAARRRPPASPTTSNTAPTRSRSTSTPSSPASASSSLTTCSPPAAPCRPPSSSSASSAARSPASAFAIELDFLKGRAKFEGYDVFSLLHYDE